MPQQINLYTLLPQEPAFRLTRSIALSVYSILLLLLLFIYGFELRQKQNLLKQNIVLNNQVTALQQELASLAERYPISDAVALRNAVQELTQQAVSKTKMLNLLTSKSNFATYLSGLASMNMQGAWFTEITFNNPDQKINLQGFALRSELVEKVLAQLDAQPGFSNLKFELQNVTEEPLPPRFEISAKQKASL